MSRTLIGPHSPSRPLIGHPTGGSKPGTVQPPPSSTGGKMASSDFLENAISSKIDEKSLNDLTNSLESSLTGAANAGHAVVSDGKPNKSELLVIL